MDIKRKDYARVKESREYTSENQGYPSDIKVIRAIESGIRMQTVADTMGLSLGKVREIRSRSNADIKAVTSFLQTATTTQKKMMAQVVRSSGGNELSSRRESLGVSRQTLRRWILAAEMGLLGEYYPTAPVQSHITMRRKSDKGTTRKELEAKIKELEDTNLLLRAECDYLKKKEEIELQMELEYAAKHGQQKS